MASDHPSGDLSTSFGRRRRDLAISTLGGRRLASDLNPTYSVEASASSVKAPTLVSL